MLKVKSTENKKGAQSKGPKKAITKADKAAKKPNQAKQGKQNVKKALKDGLVKAPTPASPKVGASPVKKVIDEKALAAKKEKQKQKKLQKKLQKKEKKEAPSETVDDKMDTAPVATKQAEQNGTKTKKVESTPDVVAKSPEKPKKKKKENKSTEIKEKSKNPPGSPEQTVFVGNLPTNTKRVQLVKLFSPFGPVLAVRFRTAGGKVIFKHKMRKESGALNAYIILKDEESAGKALELNGTEFKGNHLRVTKTDKPEESVDNKRVIFVGNLKYSATDEKLRQIFSSCGEIEYVRALQDADKGCKGVAFVCFKNPDAVGLALELKGTILDERPIHVERYSVNKLGAKVKRDSEAENAKGKPQQKGNKFGKKGGAGKPNASKASADDGAKKKSEFRGVKSDMKQKKQKKKIPSEMKKLAKKIAPKDD